MQLSQNTAGPVLALASPQWPTVHSTKFHTQNLGGIQISWLGNGVGNSLFGFSCESLVFGKKEWIAHLLIFWQKTSYSLRNQMSEFPALLSCTLGGVIFKKINGGIFQVVTNCWRTPIPKYHLLKLATFGGARPVNIFPVNPKISNNKKCNIFKGSTWNKICFLSLFNS